MSLISAHSSESSEKCADVTADITLQSHVLLVFMPQLHSLSGPFSYFHDFLWVDQLFFFFLFLNKNGVILQVMSFSRGLLMKL